MTQSDARRPAGMIAFSFVWFGQLVSVLATQMTSFALTIWAYQATGSATALALVQVFFITPFLIFSPVAGALVDRYDRKLMMMVSDLGAGLGTVLLLVLQATGQLEIWHLYLTAAIAGLGNCFQWPAYSAAISVMVPKAQYGRANGMMSLIEIGPGVLAPLLAGALLPFIQLTGILIVDVVTFVLAIAVLLAVAIPNPKRTAEGEKARSNLLRESVFGFGYIFKRPSLLGLQLVFFFGNLFMGIGFAVLAPMVLARTGNDSVLFGAVQTAGAVGGILGGVLMSAWGGFKRRVHGVLLGWIWSGLAGTVLLGLGREWYVWAIALFLGALAIPLVNGSNQAIWQAKVPPDLQGRVFSARRLIAWFTQPVAPLIGATLADFVLEPRMRAQTGLSEALGWVTGTGPGTGMGLLIVACGLAAAAVGLGGYFFAPVREAEDRLPDHDAAPEPTAAAAAD